MFVTSQKNKHGHRGKQTTNTTVDTVIVKIYQVYMHALQSQIQAKTRVNSRCILDAVQLQTNQRHRQQTVTAADIGHKFTYSHR